MKNVIVLDTETTNDIDNPLCYDIGYAIVNTESGEVLKTASFAVADIFLDKELMSYAYFAEKIPSYWDEIKNGSRVLARLSTIRYNLVKDMKAYNVNEVYAHNMRFDYLSTALTQRFVTCSKYRYFFPYGTKICDTLKMSRKAFGKDSDYIKFCNDNEYTTQNGKPRFTAEILYRYLKNDNEFVEEHKGLDDVLIEKDILLECLKRGVNEGGLWD